MISWISQWMPVWLPVLLVFLVALYVYSTWEFSTWRDLGVPGPRPYPITGSLHKLWKKPVYEVDYEEHRTYGDMFGIFEGRKPAIQLSNTDVVKDILFNNEKDFVPIPTILGGHRCPFVFSNTSHEEEVLAAKHLTTVLQPHYIKKLAFWIDRSSARVVEALLEDVAGKKISNIKAHTSQMVAEILLGCFLGIKAESGEGMELTQSMVRMAVPKISAMTPVLAVLPEALRNLVSPKSYSKQRLEPLKEAISKAVERGIVYSEENILLMCLKEEKKTKQTDDKQQEITDNQQNSKGISNELKEQLILEILLSAQEVTSNALTQIIYQLALNSEIQDQLGDRLRKIEVQSKWNDETLEQDPLIEAIILESMRIMPPVTRLQRKCCTKFQAKDISIPEGTPLNISLYNIHHSRDVYPEPDIFEIGRDFNYNLRTNVAFLPFGGGRHRCIGEHLAMKILKMSMATIVKQFHFETSILTQIPFEGAILQTLLTDRTGVWLKAHIRV